MYWGRIGIWAVALTWPVLALWETTPNLLFHFQNPVLPGQSLYFLSKVCGLYALILIWLQAIAGMLTRDVNYRHLIFPSAIWHPRVGICAISLIAGHVALFVAAASARNQHFAWKLFLPSVFEGYYKLMLSVGLIGLFCLLVGVLAAGFRKRVRVWRWGHRLAALALVLGLAHSFAIGSETRGYAMISFYLVAIGSLVLVIKNVIAQKTSAGRH